MRGRTGPDQRDRTEEVRREQRLDIAVLGLLDGGTVSVRGVVDENIDCAESLFGGADSRRDLSRVGDVERKCECGLRVRVDQRLGRGRVPGGRSDIVTAVERRLREGAAEAGRASGDEPGGHDV